MPCLITGTLRNPSGEPATRARVSVHSYAIIATDDGASLPVVIAARTDNAGQLQITLLPGVYTLRWDSGNGVYSSPLSVPDEPTADLGDLLVAAPVPVRGPEGPPGPSGQSVTVTIVEDANWPPPADPDPLHWYVRVP